MIWHWSAVFEISSDRSCVRNLSLRRKCYEMPTNQCYFGLDRGMRMSARTSSTPSYLFVVFNLYLKGRRTFSDAEAVPAYLAHASTYLADMYSALSTHRFNNEQCHYLQQASSQSYYPLRNMSSISWTFFNPKIWLHEYKLTLELCQFIYLVRTITLNISREMHLPKSFLTSVLCNKRLKMFTLYFVYKIILILLNI